MQSDRNSSTGPSYYRSSSPAAMAEWSNASRCRRDGFILRGFESLSPHKRNRPMRGGFDLGGEATCKGTLREGFESRSAAARGGVAQICTGKLCVTESLSPQP